MAQGDTPVYKYLIMYVIIGVLFYLAVVKKFEPLLLLPIAFGMLLANLPGAELFHMDFFLEEHPDYGMILQQGGLLDLLYIGVKLGIYPSLIFMGVGAMTDFTPLIADPKSLLLGAAAQFGVFAAFTGALAIGFTSAAAAAIGIIGGADGPTGRMAADHTSGMKLVIAIAGGLLTCCGLRADHPGGPCGAPRRSVSWSCSSDRPW